MCVCYHSSECYEPFKAKVRYQQKALDVGNEINVGIKVMEDIDVPWNLHSALTTGNQQEGEEYWYVCICTCI